VLAAVGRWRGSASASEAASENFRASRKAVGEFVPAPNVSYAALVADDDDFDSTFDGVAVFAAGGGGAAGSGLRKDNLADAVAVADGIADIGQNASHLGVFGSEDALAWKKHLEEDGPEERRSEDTAEHSENENQGRDKDVEVVQEITGSAEPAEEGRDGEAIHGGEAVAVMRSTMRSMAVRHVADVDAADVKVGEASDEREHAEDETNAEADEIEGVHIIWCSVWQLFFEPAG
jgi:hypothetical protein